MDLDVGREIDLDVASFIDGKEMKLDTDMGVDTERFESTSVLSQK